MFFFPLSQSASTSGLRKKNFPPPETFSMYTKRKFRVGRCTRILLVAATFWLVMQLALLPKEKDSATPWNVATTRPPSPPRRIVYVHIGKTGGEWIKSQLKIVCKTRKNPQIKQACLDSFTESEGLSTHLSQQTVGYLHSYNVFPKNAHALASHYLYSIRHPLKRLISWYIYNHPRSCDPRENNSPSCKKNAWKARFFDCFPTLEDFGQNRALFDSTEKSDCSNILWDGWFGKVSNVKDPNHLFWNYQFYWNQTQEDKLSSSFSTSLYPIQRKPIVVVRQENLIQDMNDLEAYLGKNRASLEVEWKPANSRHFLSGRVMSSLSKRAMQNLCCVLHDEFVIYHAMIEGAENLQFEAKQETIDKALKECGAVNSWLELGCQ